MSLALVVVFALAAQVEPPPSWTCEVARFADGVCDCGCNAIDDNDCPEGAACERENCPPGTVLDEGSTGRLLCRDPEPQEPGGCAGAPALLVLAPLLRRRRR